MGSVLLAALVGVLLGLLWLACFMPEDPARRELCRKLRRLSARLRRRG